MTDIIQNLAKKGLINPPSFIVGGTHYQVMMGSISYGVSNDSSDIDIYGFCIEPKKYIFPHLDGKIINFDKDILRFDQYQQHHCIDKETLKEYDLNIYSIIKYFRLCANNNPNMIDSLFVPVRCILHITQIGQMVRDQRRIFLHKGSWHRYKGYAYSQIHKIKTKNPEQDSKRRELIEKYGYDTKFSYHVVRLLNQAEQILIEGDLDLERNREQLKAIRNGEWTVGQIFEYFQEKEKQLEEVYSKSELQHSPDETKIRNLLLNCLEQYYGSIDNCINIAKSEDSKIVNEIKEVLKKYGRI